MYDQYNSIFVKSKLTSEGTIEEITKLLEARWIKDHKMVKTKEIIYS